LYTSVKILTRTAIEFKTLIPYNTGLFL